MASLEERVDKLERRAVAQMGRINALEKIALSAFSEVIMQSPDPIAYITSAKEAWTGAPSTPARPFPGVDPVYLDLVSAEYDKAIADILGMLEAHIRSLVAARSGRLEEG